MNKIAIRPAKLGDAYEAASLVFDILRSYGIEPDPSGLDADVVAFGTENSLAIKELVAEDTNQIIGIATLSLRDNKDPFCTALYVKPAFRGKGIGRKLLVQLVEEAKQLGYKKIQLETRTMFVEAVKLYESLGWKRGTDLPAGYGPDRTYYLELN